MVSTAFIRDCIMDASKTHLIRNAIAQGTSQYSMQTFDQSLFRLCEEEIISTEEALRWATNVDEFVMKMQGVRSTSDTAVDEMARSSATSASPDPRSNR
jgi:twitching motility protein PilT